MPRRQLIAVLCWAAALTAAPVALGAQVRIKDITEVDGARPNQLTGMGLVIGLDGTGGRSTFTQQVAADMVRRFNTNPRLVAENRTDPVFRSSNISLVMVTAQLGPFMRRGSRLDVVISILDDGTSLQGGTLLMTPLRGADGVDYAVAQGAVSLGGFLFTVPTGTQQPLASVQKNHPTVGRIPGGAFIEREARGQIACNGQVRLLLHQADFATARSIAQAINAKFPTSALTLDAGTVSVVVPPERSAQLVEFVSDLGALEVTPDSPARVVINERTGTIVAGQHVKISMVAVAHGNLSIITREDFLASQALPFAGGGRTEVLPQGSIGVTEQGSTVGVMPNTVTLAEFAQALNALGATPRDLITILQVIKESGALHAELIIM